MLVFETSKSCKSSAFQTKVVLETFQNMPSLVPPPSSSPGILRWASAAAAPASKSWTDSRCCGAAGALVCQFLQILEGTNADISVYGYCMVRFCQLHSLPQMPRICYSHPRHDREFAIVGVSLSFRIFLLKWIWTSIPWRLQSHWTTSLKERLHSRSSCSSRKFCRAPWPWGMGKVGDRL